MSACTQSSDWQATMRWYVYLIGFIVSIILAIIGGVAFRFLEVENERQAAKTASVQLQELFG